MMHDPDFVGSLGFLLIWISGLCIAFLAADIIGQPIYRFIQRRRKRRPDYIED